MQPASLRRQFELLAVEDNPLDLRALTRAASRLDVPVELTTAGDGGEALRLLRSGQPIDMVLLDLNLPLVDGHEVLETMRADERLRLLPVMIITTSDDAGDIRRAYELGANAFVNKPVDLAGWDDLMQRVAAFWLSLVHFPPPVA